MILNIPNNFRNFYSQKQNSSLKTPNYSSNSGSIKSADSVSFRGSIDEAIFLKLRSELLTILKKEGQKHVDFKPLVEVASKGGRKIRVCGDDESISLIVGDLKNLDKCSIYFIEPSGKVVCGSVKTNNLPLKSVEESLKLQEYIDEVLSSKKK